jgi:hypothetical protein
VRRGKALDFSGCNSRPGTGSLHPVAIEAAAEATKLSELCPPEEHFTVGTVGNEDEMRFRIEVFNSVDGSCRLMAIAGWLRFVCTNGLIIGEALMQLQQHRVYLERQGKV